MSGRLILVWGGSGSGKSAWAEKTLLAEAARAPGGRAVYLAAMETSSPEAAARIARHRAMRAQHGAEAGLDFATVERPTDIGGAPVSPGDFVLLEDLGNLLANEIWSPSGAGLQDASDHILSGVHALLERVSLLVIVSNDLFADGQQYDEGTMAYIDRLASLHRALSAIAERTVEVVCGIPLISSGGRDGRAARSGVGILICGLNGVGKSTLGRALAEKLQLHFIDSEDLYFPKTDARYLYASPRTREEVEELLLREIEAHPDHIFASVKGDYGEAVTSRFRYAVWVEVPRDIRLERVRDRSFQKFGSRMLPGGDLHEQEEKFFHLAASRAENAVEEWIGRLDCPVIRIDGTKPVEENVDRIAGQIAPWIAKRGQGGP